VGAGGFGWLGGFGLCPAQHSLAKQDPPSAKHSPSGAQVLAGRVTRQEKRFRGVVMSQPGATVTFLWCTMVLLVHAVTTC